MEIALAGLLNIASLGGIGYLSSCLKKEKLKLKDIEGARVFSPSRLLSHLAKPEFISKLKQSLENPDEYLLKTFVEGYVDCNNPIHSIIDGKTKLIHSLYYKDEIYSNDSFAKARGHFTPRMEGVETRAPLVFEIKDPSKDKTVIVHRNLAVDATSALERIAESREYKHLNWFERLLVYLGVIVELIALMTRTTFVLRGVKIGWNENEFGVPVNQPLTVFGEVIYNLRENSLRMDTPQYYLHDKAYIVKKIKENIYGIQGKMILLVIPLLITSFYLAKKANNYYKKLKRKQMEIRMDKLWKVKSVKMKDDYKCIVCFDRPRNIITKPCLHFSMCGVCCNRLEKKACPVCKKSINDVVEVFFT